MGTGFQRLDWRSNSGSPNIVHLIAIIFSDKEESGPPDGRILFQKPSKRKSEGTVKTSSENKSALKPKKKKETPFIPSLLSFDNDEDEYT